MQLNSKIFFSPAKFSYAPAAGIQRRAAATRRKIPGFQAVLCDSRRRCVAPGFRSSLPDIASLLLLRNFTCAGGCFKAHNMTMHNRGIEVFVEHVQSRTDFHRPQEGKNLRQLDNLEKRPGRVARSAVTPEVRESLPGGLFSFPERGQDRTGNILPGTKDRRRQGGAGTLQHLHGQPRGHAAVLHAHLDRNRARICFA